MIVGLPSYYEINTAKEIIAFKIFGIKVMENIITLMTSPYYKDIILYKRDDLRKN